MLQFTVFVTFCFCFPSLLLFFGPSSLPSFRCLVSSLAHQLDVEMLVCFTTSVSLPSSFISLSCLPSVFIVSSFCWSINWTYHRTDLTIKLQPCPVGTRPAPCANACWKLPFVLSFRCFIIFVSVSFLFTFLLVFFFWCTYEPWICSWYILFRCNR